MVREQATAFPISCRKWVRLGAFQGEMMLALPANALDIRRDRGWGFGARARPVPAHALKVARLARGEGRVAPVGELS
jgi:hypothetical protein